MNKEYYIGLDMGTNSVGWAVTDNQYQLIRKKGKDFWGVREFDEAKTAVERRTKRTSRRRRQRELARIGVLKSYFADEIQKTDPLFYIRLDNSKYFKEDKAEELIGYDGIFSDTDYKDSDYFKEFPTIYHLRKALIEDRVAFDARYARKVYLALLNMFKHRGHFLGGSISDNDTNATFSESWKEFVNNAFVVLNTTIKCDNPEKIKNILADRSTSRTGKAEAIIGLLEIDKSDKKSQMLIKCMCGLKCDAKKLFDDIETDDKVEINFSDNAYADNIDKLQADIGEFNYTLIESIKVIYDEGMLSYILKGEKYLSFARVNDYEKHKEDLTILKKLYAEMGDDLEYDAMFRKDEPGSYSAYVGSVNTEKYNGKKPSRRNAADGTKETLYKNIKNFLTSKNHNKYAEYVLNEIDRGTFLPKQATSDNGVIPNSVHLKEMKKILSNAEKYLPFLSEKDESGLTLSERISQLFSFQIPYYVGPLCSNSKNYWAIRKENGKIYPWNLERKIDVDKTAEEFINRLIKDCTYLSGEKVLPKRSLMYEAFCVLNEINNLKIDGEKITVELKQAIYKDLFENNAKVTKNKIVNYLINIGAINEAQQLTGIDVNVNSALSSYAKFKSIFGDNLETDNCKKIAERVIYICTVFGDAPKMRERALKKEFTGVLSEQQMKEILRFKFKDWGRFSKELLLLEGCNPETGEVWSIIRAMWETNFNFMELINAPAFLFKESLESRANTSVAPLMDFEFEDLDEYYYSAPVKRMIWQTILLMKEIEKVMGYAPSKIFIEMTRSDEEKGDKGRKDSRSKQLIELYKDIKDQEFSTWSDRIKEAGESGKLRSKKLFLYYLQMGKCAYTGENIDLEKLLDANSDYDIDHIYPRHYVKDDNIMNNLVLVNKRSNAYKSDNYPLPTMPQNVYDLWRYLHAHKLMSDEKYKRLMCRTPFDDEQMSGFIARQLVETSQGTKGIADLLKMLVSVEETKIIYSKGSNVSEFRNRYDLLKSRSLNDFHHAKDAYLNIVVGNVYYTKFTQNPMNFIKNEVQKKGVKYHLGKMYDYNVERNGYTAWIASDKSQPGTIATVKRVMDRNTPMITRLTFENKGAFSKETIYPADQTKEDAYIPVKGSDSRLKDVSKYGGTTKVSGAYFFVVEHSVKNKRVRTIEMVPIYRAEYVNDNEEKLLEFCKDELNLTDANICLKKIKMQSLLRIDGFVYRLSGRTGNRLFLRNEIPMCLNQQWSNYVSKIDKAIEGTKGLVDAEKNVELYDIFYEKYANGIFSKRKNAVGNVLALGRETFINADILQQCKVLKEILGLSVFGPTSADLKSIGGSSATGVMAVSKNITDLSECVLINQSVTGIYENSIDLLKV